MKIVLPPNLPFNDIQSRNSLYNSVKRYEEDLVRRFPFLKEVSLDFRYSRLLSSGANSTFESNYNLAEDESSITIKIDYSLKPSVEKVCKVIINEISKIKSEYGYD